MSQGGKSWPKALVAAAGPFREDKLVGAVEGMGQWGAATCTLANERIVPPDMMTGLTLFILSHQPKDPNKKPAIPGGGGGVAGGVWVRERFTIHQPLDWSEEFKVTGTAVGRHVHKGRRYGTNTSQTYAANGALAGTNVTTGLLAYKVEEGLDDQVEGTAPDAIASPQPDWQAARHNPCLDALDSLEVGEVLDGDVVQVGIELMQARDTKKPDNPIHSDPELARKAGLAKPIAGGSHVLAFVLEVILQRCGAHSLLHGAMFDVRWKAPVMADVTLRPRAEVIAKDDKSVVFALTAYLEDDRVAMQGSVTVPLANGEEQALSGPSHE